jgi:hypothetical protein
VTWSLRRKKQQKEHQLKRERKQRNQDLAAAVK